MLKRFKNTSVMKPVKVLYKKLRYGIYPSFAKPRYFLNNSKDSDSACFILAGYKQFTWDIVFERIKQFCPSHIDVCIVSSGIYSEELKQYAEKYCWSYISIKRNCVTQALNSAINCFPSAKNIFKIDEDIFITKGFFEELPKAFSEASKEYFPAFSAPLIPINGYGYRRVLERLNLVETYTKKFEYPKISAGIHIQVENNPEVAKFFWGEENIVPHIDELNALIQSENRGGVQLYGICPIRFSIGAIYFQRSLLDQYGWFPVRKGNGMGTDEEFICNLATSRSKAIVVSERQVVGHLSFGKQNKPMQEYFLANKERFEIKEKENER